MVKHAWFVLCSYSPPFLCFIDTRYTVWLYSRFTVSSPVCPLHIAVTHVIKVLEPRSSHEFQWQLAREAPQFQYYDHMSGCSVQWETGLETLKRLYKLL